VSEPAELASGHYIVYTLLCLAYLIPSFIPFPFLDLPLVDDAVGDGRRATFKMPSGILAGVAISSAPHFKSSFNTDLPSALPTLSTQIIRRHP
jgi:hypothetical protein